MVQNRTIDPRRHGTPDRIIGASIPERGEMGRKTMSDSMTAAVLGSAARWAGAITLYIGATASVLLMLAWCLAAGIMRRTAEDTWK